MIEASLVCSVELRTEMRERRLSMLLAEKGHM